MTEIVAIDYDAGKALFKVRTAGVIVDINNTDAARVQNLQRALTASAWMKVAKDFEYPGVWRELAEAAVAELEVKAKPVTASGADRKFRIPQAVKEEAQLAIEWTRGFNRGNSVIGMSIANDLVNEKYLTFTRLQRIAKYFSRRPQSITENAGWKTGEMGFPTDDRIKYSLWGGEAAREWVSKINEKHPLLASTEPVPDPNMPIEEAPVTDGDADLDGNDPHDYVEDPEVPLQCLVCGREQENEIHTGIVAAGFTVESECEYFGKGVDPDSTEVSELYKRNADGTWELYVSAGAFEPMDEPAEDEIIIMLDPESARILAQYIDEREPGAESDLFELATINPFEYALYTAAEAEIDWELVDRVFDIYDSQERSVNAKKQVRGPGGKFGDMPDDPESKKTADQPTKARLPEALPLVPDVAARIDKYLADVAKKRGGETPEPEETPGPEGGEPVTAAAGDPGTVTDVRPLYLAIVDSVDTEAVLDLISLVPPAAGTQGDVVAWKRNNGTWVQDNAILASLRGVTPPPVVEITDDALLANVVEQVDKATTESEPEPDPQPAPTSPEPAKPDANPDQHPVPVQASAEFGDKSPEKREKLSKKGYALPDGSYPIESVEDLKNAIQAFGRAKNKTLARTHIIKRARALNRLDLLPDDWDRNEREQGYALWGPQGEILPISAAAEGGADRNRGNAEELRKYWTKGEGAAKIQWNTPGDWYRCVAQLSKYLGPRAKGYCSLRHKETTGHWPGEEENH